MGNEIKVDLSQTKYQSITELKGAASEELKDKNKVGGAYSDNGQDQIFGGDGLKEGATKDDVLAELKKRGISDDVALGLWTVANTNAEDDIIDADEFASLISTYESDFNDSKKGSVTLTSWINKLDKTPQNTEKTTDKTETSTEGAEGKEEVKSGSEQAQDIEGSSEDLLAEITAEAEKETDKTDETEDKTIANAAEQFKNLDTKVKQDENGQYYVETDKWDTNAKDNLDCISRIIYNTYGVGYKSEEGQAILARLQEANQGTPFANGLVYPNQRINLVDCSDILGLTVASADEADEPEGAGETPETDESKEETPTDKPEDKKESLTPQQRTENLEGVKMINTDGRTKTFEGVNADGETVTYTQDYNGDLVGNVKTATKDENGNIIQENSYAQDGSFEASWFANGSYPFPTSTRSVAADGKILSETVYNRDENNKVVSKEVNTYAEDGKTVAQTQYFNADGVETDKDGNVLNPQEGTPTGGAAPTAEEQEAQLRNEVADLRAQTLYAAMDRAGTDEDAVRKIVSGLQGQDLVDVMNAYEQKYGESLEDAIKDDFSFLSGQDRLLGNLDAAKNYASVSPREAISEDTILAAKMDAINAACDRHGTTESVLNDIILNSSPQELQELIAYYNSNTDGKDFKSRVLGEVSGQQDKILRQKIEQAENFTPSETDANRPAEGTEEYQQWQEAKLRTSIANARVLSLHAAMDRAGTDEDAVRKIVSGLQGQDLVDVMNAYEQKYGESLEDAIKDDFSFLSGQDRLLGNLDAAKNYASVSPREEISEQSVIDAYADAFLTATSSRLGIDEKAVYSILTDGTLSDEQIIQLANTLAARGESITSIIKKEFSFSTEDGLLARLQKLGIQ